ncbi:hypothetical protein C6P46_003357 [Rhodotorula mucilaginosa]|jgi:pre-rRNA-processing protein TSR2|uniref:Pre-rRNA-processing protein TSR2 n=1 Tax=Rhodotorula mucilaginosa TaxID=5537 RepID=A0A9P6W4M9_RHOMI|nr:hypothetical protein C6P46_003357 [Rhodotorula mucilaginosa]
MSATPSTSSAPAAAAPAAAPQPSAEDLALGLFARASLDLFDVWPALRLAISHGWGGNGQEGKTALAEDIVDLFYTVATSGTTSSTSSANANASTSTSTQEGGVPVPAQDEVEQTLTYVIGNEFDVDLEDGSETAVARDLIALWRECIQRVQQQQQASGVDQPGEEGPLAKKFREGAERARAQDGQQQFAAQRQGGNGAGDDEDEDETTSEEDDDDEEDEDDEMEGVIDEPAPQLVESRPEPVIDEDGFELVQPKKKGGRR